MPSRRRAFTLVELLVVIGIISVLVAALMPAFAAARRQSRAVVCLSNLRQFAAMFHEYVSENKGRAPTYLGHGPLDFLKIPRNDTHTFPEIAFCPEAVGYGKPQSGGQIDFYPGAASLAWGVWYARAPAVEVPWWGLRGSSYGMNGWTLSPVSHPPPARQPEWDPRVVRTSSRRSDAVPLFGDAVSGVASPLPTDTPPASVIAPNFVESGQAIGMRTFCVARHRRGINVVFLDGHARRVPLEELWRLEWHN
jgi:prepilin-type N-terminal cleavage/methylation domain-containing protein/prepilin-type processing-associated H-X9-DG protein